MTHVNDYTVTDKYGKFIIPVIILKEVSDFSSVFSRQFSKISQKW